MFEADSRWANTCLGYHIQARPDGETVESLLNLQCEIAAASPVDLHLVPPKSLHSSIVTLVAPQRNSDAAEADWQKIRGNIGKELEALARNKTPVSIAFPRIAFTAQAVIVVTDVQPALFALLRARFGTLLESLGLPVRRYDQTHVTIARFAQTGSDENGVVESIEQMPLKLQGHFNSISFMRERRYPSLETEEI